VATVYLFVARVARHGRCRFARQYHGFTGVRACSHPLWLRARGTGHWSYGRRGVFPPGSYVARVWALDRSGNRERPTRRLTFRIR
jgi:hypothetical protein